jgi:hypothetical protein
MWYLFGFILSIVAYAMFIAIFENAKYNVRKYFDEKFGKNKKRC